jgi:hypothetical protein
MTDLPTGTATFLFSDIEGSTGSCDGSGPTIPACSTRLSLDAAISLALSARP